MSLNELHIFTYYLGFKLIFKDCVGGCVGF